MPLINDHQVKQNLERSQDVIKVVVAVAICVEVRALELDIPAECSDIPAISTVAIRGRITSFHLDQVTKQLHAHYGVDVVQHLQIKRTQCVVVWLHYITNNLKWLFLISYSW